MLIPSQGTEHGAELCIFIRKQMTITPLVTCHIATGASLDAADAKRARVRLVVEVAGKQMGVFERAEGSSPYSDGLSNT